MEPQESFLRQQVEVCCRVRGFVDAVELSGLREGAVVAVMIAPCFGLFARRLLEGGDGGLDRLALALGAVGEVEEPADLVPTPVIDAEGGLDGPAEGVVEGDVLAAESAGRVFELAAAGTERENRERHYHRRVIMHESDLLSHIFRRSAGQRERFPHVLLGPGDDCALVRAGGAEVLLKSDQVVEGRHFVPGTPVELVARKALCRALSDVAAMAGTPVAALAGATLPQGFPRARAEELSDALHAWGERYSCPVVGGDIATGSERLVLCISILATPHATRGSVTRSGARAEDAVYVTGALGGSFKEDGGGRHLTFEPRLREARWLAGALGPSLHAMMDISDGLGLDASRLARCSGVAIEIEASAVPRCESVADVKNALGDGEDYELLFTTDADVPRVCPETGTRITRIGRVVEGPTPGAFATINAVRTDLSLFGWEHA